MPDSRPALSVVIPVYNGAAHIADCLDSLRAQSRTDFEVIVVDDGSTDGSAEIVERVAAETTAPVIHLIRQDNAGVSAARNRGIAAVTSPLIGFLDCDDLWHPEKAALQIEAMAQHPEVDLCFTGFSMIDEHGDDLLERSIPPAGHITLQMLMIRNLIHTSTAVVRTSAITELGGFDEGLSMFEDFELWLRVGALRDPGLFALPEVLCAYRRHSTQATRDWQAMHNGWRSVADRLEARHPEQWRKVRTQALGHNLEYCASLAYNAGDIPEMRRLMSEALTKAAPYVLRRKDGIIMTGILVCSYLPRPVQLAIGRAFVALRRTKRRWEGNPGLPT